MPHVKIGIGAISVEYEGEQKFIENGLMALVERVIERAGHVPSVDKRVRAEVSTLDMSTNTVAQMISVKTGSDLALAAIAKINLVKGQNTAARQDILDEMREASTFFKETYVSNLSAYLVTLVRSKRVNLVAKSTYALAAGERKRLSALLASDGEADE